MEQRFQPQILALVRDLIFASRIGAQAKAAGVEIKILRDPAQLAGESSPLLLVDLNQPGTIPAAAQWSKSRGGQVVGFVSHVDAQTIQLARASGIEKVMARSGFVEALPALLAGLAAGSEKK